MSIRASILGVATVLVVFICPADAALKHRYSFNEGPTTNAAGRTIIDSVGGRNGTVIGPVGAGGAPTATAEQIVLPGGPSATAPYVDLPNGIISALTDATFEAWYTIDTAQAWSRVFDFGSTTGGELSAPGGGSNGQDFIFYAPMRGTDLATQRVGFGNDDPLFLGSAAGAVAGGFSDLDPEFTHVIGTQYHAAVVIDADGGGPSIATQTLYINGVPAPDGGGGPSTINSAHQLANLNDVNNWLGRSNWTQDSSFGGSFNEFRIYDNALSASEVAQSSILGPDALEGEAIFSVEVNTTTGQTRLLNHRAETMTFDYYELSSAGGALNAAGWTGIDGDTPAGEGWDKSGGASANLLREFYLPESGYAFPANGSLPIGNALNPAVFGAGNPGDLEFRFGLASGALLTGTVNYVSTAPQVAGDYNQNGVVDAADYVIWRKNVGGTTLPNRGTGISGPVGMSDYDLWRSRFGATSGSGGGAVVNVPEPATLVLLLFGCMATRTGRRGARFNNRVD